MFHLPPCNICLEDLLTDVCVTPCSHVYHSRCLLQWLKRKKSCPLCKRPLQTSQLVQAVDFSIQPEICVEEKNETFGHVNVWKQRAEVLQNVLSNTKRALETQNEHQENILLQISDEKHVNETWQTKIDEFKKGTYVRVEEHNALKLDLSKGIKELKDKMKAREIVALAKAKFVELDLSKFSDWVARRAASKEFVDTALILILSWVKKRYEETKSRMAIVQKDSENYREVIKDVKTEINEALDELREKKRKRKLELRVLQKNGKSHKLLDVQHMNSLLLPSDPFATMGGGSTGSRKTNEKAKLTQKKKLHFLMDNISEIVWLTRGNVLIG